jgi:prephenate dehydratase
MAKQRWAYLGPAGTFSHEALRALDPPDAEHVPFPTIGDVFEAVESRECERGIVPIENLIEGSVNATLDGLAFDHELTVQAEYVHDIHHALIAAPGAKLADVRVVTSHPHATAQCRRWLWKNLPGVDIAAANSTAEAVQRAVGEPGVAAVGTELAASLSGGEVLARSIEDHKGNQTRFVVLGTGLQEATGKDKTSLALFLHKDKPGALLMILSEFAYAGINLTKIQSRPTKKQLGEYMFFVDLEGHVRDNEVATALDCLRLQLRTVKVLGSYPRAK